MSLLVHKESRILITVQLNKMTVNLYLHDLGCVVIQAQLNKKKQFKTNLRTFLET